MRNQKKEYAIILQDVVHELKLLEDIGFEALIPTTDLSALMLSQ